MYIKSKKIIVKLNNENIRNFKYYNFCRMYFRTLRSKDIFAIDKNKIIEIFKNKGVIIFRNFNLNKDNIIKFTDLFTSKYANDALEELLGWVIKIFMMLTQVTRKCHYIAKQVIHPHGLKLYGFIAIKHL